MSEEFAALRRYVRPEEWLGLVGAITIITLFAWARLWWAVPILAAFLAAAAFCLGVLRIARQMLEEHS